MKQARKQWKPAAGGPTDAVGAPVSSMKAFPFLALILKRIGGIDEVAGALPDGGCERNRGQFHRLAPLEGTFIVEAGTE